jgi:PII-like signaling protein
MEDLMVLEGEGKLLRIFIGESDKHGHTPLYEAIVIAARKEGMAGATVLRGMEGFGADSRIIHTAKILRLSEDLPIVVELVDTEERINRFTAVVGQMIEESRCGAMITEERAHVIHYRTGKDTSQS